MLLEWSAVNWATREPFTILAMGTLLEAKVRYGWMVLTAMVMRRVLVGVNTRGSGDGVVNMET
jgi:hypothetical protein